MYTNENTRMIVYRKKKLIAGDRKDETRKFWYGKKTSRKYGEALYVEKNEQKKKEKEF